MNALSIVFCLKKFGKLKSDNFFTYTTDCSFCCFVGINLVPGPWVVVTRRRFLMWVQGEIRVCIPVNRFSLAKERT